MLIDVFVHPMVGLLVDLFIDLPIGLLVDLTIGLLMGLLMGVVVGLLVHVLVDLLIDLLANARMDLWVDLMLNLSIDLFLNSYRAIYSHFGLHPLCRHIARRRRAASKEYQAAYVSFLDFLSMWLDGPFFGSAADTTGRKFDESVKAVSKKVYQT